MVQIYVHIMFYYKIQNTQIKSKIHNIYLTKFLSTVHTPYFIAFVVYLMNVGCYIFTLLCGIAKLAPEGHQSFISPAVTFIWSR